MIKEYIMPPKARIEEKLFQNALRSLPKEELDSLNNSKLTSNVWNVLCVQMGKADNAENRRACYDAWRQNRYKSQEIVHNILRELDSSTTMNNVQEVNIEKRKSPYELEAEQLNITVKSDLMQYNTETPINSTQNSNIFQCPKADYSQVRITNESSQFMERLQKFLSEQNRNISIRCTHDINSTSCSGDILSIQLYCACPVVSSVKCDKDEHNLVTSIFPSNKNEETNSKTGCQSDNAVPETESKLFSLAQINVEHDVISQDIESNNTDSETLNKSLITKHSHVTTSSLSLESSSNSLKNSDVLLSPAKLNKLSVVSRIIERAKNILSPKKNADHEILTDDQKNVVSLLSRQAMDGSDFTRSVAEIQNVERKKAIVVSRIDMEQLKILHENYVEKKNNKNNKNGATSSNYVKDAEIHKRRLDWTFIFDKYVRESNDYCVFMYDRHHFTTRTVIGNTSQFFMSVDAHCKFEKCSCKFHAILSENGELKVNYAGAIIHESGEIHARPIRGSRREELQKFSTLGCTPNALRLQQFKTMSPANKEAGNRNVVGSSPSVIRKISSEANVKLRRDEELDKSLRLLKKEQADKIFPGEQVPGYLQEISMEPLRLICFTAGGLAAYHQFASTMALSWDATGGIVINNNKKIYYYELTMSNLTKNGPSLPLTVMVSDSHGTMDIVHWMNCFIEKYKGAYGFSNPFPRPPIIHCDRALVFLLAGIQIFNNDETMNRYIERCWRIVQGVATKRDLELTVVHACLGHFMKSVKKNAIKNLAKKQVSFGMWLMALLVNSNTLDEMAIVWRNICIVLSSPSQNDYFKISLSTLSKMADEMNGNPEKTNFVLQNVSVTSQGQLTSVLNIDDEPDLTTGVTLGEEEAVAAMESPFKTLFKTIYQDCKKLIKNYDDLQRKNLPSNPLFSPSYLAHVLKLHMPVAPIWSNLLLGDFACRYNYSSAVASKPCVCHFGRTTGISESQMRVLKEAILNKKVYNRVDEVISKMGDIIEAVEMQYADHVLIKRHKDRILPAKKQKLAEEQWNKRRQAKPTQGVYTSQKPTKNLVSMINTRLLGQNDDALLDSVRSTQFLRFENKESNSWFNSIFQMMLASKHLVEAVCRFGSITADVECSSIVMVVGNILHILAGKTSYGGDDNRTVVDKDFIIDHFGYFRWAGLDIRSHENNWILKFFINAIVPTLLFHDMELQFVMNNSMTCSSCGKVTTIDKQTWNYLHIQGTSKEGSLDEVVADLFGATVQKKVCSECLNDGSHTCSLSLMNCPKHLFVYCEPAANFDKQVYKLKPHVDIHKILSDDITFTSSYTRYTLQSFLTFYINGNTRHYLTYARHKEDWYRLDDMNVKVVPCSTIFQDQTKLKQIVLAHYIRPSETDVFSTALFRTFTNFSAKLPDLKPTLCLNDATMFFAKSNTVKIYPLNLVVIKVFKCLNCRKETYMVDKMHKIWQMKNDAEHINMTMENFIQKQIQCSSCKKFGLTSVVLYDIPRFILLNTRSNDTDCVKLIDEAPVLKIQPSIIFPTFEYSIQTVLISLEEDQIVYLRKKDNVYYSFNTASEEFEILRDITTEQMGLASKWTIFAYETDATVFELPDMKQQKIVQNHLESPSDPDVFLLDSVRRILPTFTRPFNVGSFQLQQRDIESLLDPDSDLNDLVINSHLFLTASNNKSKTRILAVDSLIILEILNRNIKRINQNWLDYEIILLPIHQNNHWYIILLHLKNKILYELDSLSSLHLPRANNIKRILHLLNIHNQLRTNTDIDFSEWKHVLPIQEKQFQQSDVHSCGVHLLTQTKAFLHGEKFIPIHKDKLRLHRFQIAHDLLRKAELISDDSSTSETELTPLKRTNASKTKPIVKHQTSTKIPKR